MTVNCGDGGKIFRLHLLTVRQRMDAIAMRAVEPSKYIVHVVDDDPAVRRAVARILGPSVYHVKRNASAGEFVLARENGLPGCSNLDVCMHGPSWQTVAHACLRHRLLLNCEVRPMASPKTQCLMRF